MMTTMMTTTAAAKYNTGNHELAGEARTTVKLCKFWGPLQKSHGPPKHPQPTGWESLV
jgi:hypothetical protein